MARRRTEWNVEEQGLIKELKEKGLHIGVILADPWAYPCGLKPSTYRDPLCAIQGIGMEFTRTLCDRLKIPCTFTELNTTEVAQSKDRQELIMQKIIYHEIDTSLPILMETNRRRDLLDFTMPLFFMEGGLLVRTKFTYSSDMMYAIKPFQPTVWIGHVSILRHHCR